MTNFIASFLGAFAGYGALYLFHSLQQKHRNKYHMRGARKTHDHEDIQ